MESSITPVSISGNSAPTTTTDPAVPVQPTDGGALPTVLKVNFLLVTPDSLRKVGFSLEKDSDGTKVTWIIGFTLYDRTDATVAFGDPVISLNVTVSPVLHDKAQSATTGLNPPQVAHATGPAADAAKAFADGTGSHLAANSSIQSSIK